jgi:molybdopterin-containing oxidoreductase family molybdopterin binding subunit
VAVGGAVAVASHTGLLGSTSKPVVRALTPGTDPVPGLVRVHEQVFNDVCSNNCQQACHLKVHVRNGRLVKTAMNPLPEPRYNRICLRGLSHAQWVYHPARLKFPMKRVGARGSGKWARITWDEAVATIASSMTSIRDRYGSKAFAIWRGFGNYGSVAGYGPNLLANAFQATGIELIEPSWGIDTAVSLGVGQIGLAGAQNESLDMSNADLLVMWGNNLTEAMVQEWHFVADAKDRGATLVVIDPNFSITASKADKWIPLRPGSDPAFGLSVLNVLVTEKLYDEAYVMAHTTLPFLVRADNGMFLRAADGTTILAWDLATGASVPADQVATPALTGTFDVNGVTVRPAFQLLADQVADWSPEKAQEYTEVNPSDVRWLARTYASSKKSFIVPSMGLDRWWNGDMNGRAIATMAAITHNFGRSGAAIGMKGGGGGGFLVVPTSPTGTHAAPLPPWQAYEAIATGKTHMLVPLDGKDPTKGVTKDPVEVPWPIKAIWFSGSNAVSNMQQSKQLIELLKDESKLELVVVSDLMPTDTVRYADIVLPTTHWFENDDLSMSPTHPYVMRNERALEAPFETKSDYAAFGLVAAKLGFEQYFTKSEAELADSIMATSTAALGAAGASLLDTWQRNGVVRFTVADFVGDTKPVFPTPSGRLEPYSERVQVNYPPGGWIPTSAGVDPLPHWEPPIQAWPTNSLHKKYPLAYMQEHSRWRVHTTWFDQPWLREIDPEPYVDISTADAKARGIVQGDYVELFNDNGKTIAVARVSGKMRPGQVNLPKGWQRFQTKDDTGFSDVTHNWINPVTSNGSYFDNLVEVRKVVV